MAETLPTEALEDSTFVVTASFSDENGDAVIPETIVWSLKDKDGGVINDRSAESETPATSIDILLTGDDLDPGTGKMGQILLTIAATYDSSLGNGLPLMAQCWINVRMLEPYSQT